MLKWINKKRNKKGFTLVELVVVIAILGILAAIAIPKLGSSKKTALKGQHNANVRILKSAAMMYVADGREYTVGDDIFGDLADFLDGNPPIPPEGLDYPAGTDSSAYKVTIDSNGDIQVEPPEVE